MPEAPPVITAYLTAAAADDTPALIALFTPDGRVQDEGQTYTGPAEIAGWREEVGAKYTYTVEVTGVESTGPAAYRVSTHVVGDFPGGEVDLGYDFTLRDGAIAALRIG